MPKALDIVCQSNRLVDGVWRQSGVHGVLGNLPWHDVVDSLEHTQEFRPQAHGPVECQNRGAAALFHVANEVFNFSLHLVPVWLCNTQRDVVFAAPCLEELVVDELCGGIAAYGIRCVPPERDHLVQVFPHAAAGVRGVYIYKVATGIHDDKRVHLTVRAERLEAHNCKVEQPFFTWLWVSLENAKVAGHGFRSAAAECLVVGGVGCWSSRLFLGTLPRVGSRWRSTRLPLS